MFPNKCVFLLSCPSCPMFGEKVWPLWANLFPKTLDKPPNIGQLSRKKNIFEKKVYFCWVVQVVQCLWEKDCPKWPTSSPKHWTTWTTWATLPIVEPFLEAYHATRVLNIVWSSSLVLVWLGVSPSKLPQATSLVFFFLPWSFRVNTTCDGSMITWCCSFLVFSLRSPSCFQWSSQMLPFPSWNQVLFQWMHPTLCVLFLWFLLPLLVRWSCVLWLVFLHLLQWSCLLLEWCVWVLFLWFLSVFGRWLLLVAVARFMVVLVFSSSSSCSLRTSAHTVK